MKISIQKSIVAVLVLACSMNAVASADRHTQWQMKMIYQPSSAMIEREANGLVMIYDGFKDYQVDQVMEDKFDRIENMMFTRVRLTDNLGNTLKDPETGAELVAEDGCDD